ncbi:metal-dependent transcriptional regulator [Chloroflexus sp.]|uniref:metal-dependent transcriptional regulator n=1 Tax=Chloroflexus sp. TaxID=1904827 RepID=UPI00298F1F08|nr:metal-dependent transcriptional regulator [Chloroflexus sp.]MDW8405346.1 metal-dependent transcriptional regulator [Chloroflexus sp.]
MVTTPSLFLPPNLAMHLTTPESACLLALADLAEDQAEVHALQLAYSLYSDSEDIWPVLRNLFARNLVTVATSGALELTAAGSFIARHLQIRHRLLERFLLDVLGVPWMFVHREASRLAPAVSPLFIERVIELTRSATVCPHGNPIPGRGAPPAHEQRLTDAPFGQRCRLTRIAEWVSYEPHRLQRLWSHELLPGRALIRVPDPFHRWVIRLDQRSLVLGQRIAAALFVAVE